MSGYKLTYFEIKGLGEPIRMVLHATEQDFEDKRIKMDDWPALKETIPSKKLPMLETPDGRILRETHAICRYLAAKNGLYSTDPEEIYRIELPIGILIDVLINVAKIIHTNEETKAKETETFRESDGPRLFDQLKDLLENSSTGFIANTTNPTLADIYLTSTLDFVVDKHDELLEKYPKLVEHKDRIIAHFPKLSEYMKNRPPTKY